MVRLSQAKVKTRKQPSAKTKKRKVGKAQSRKSNSLLRPLIRRDLSSIELQDLATAGECSVSYVSRVFSRRPGQVRGLTFGRAKLFADRLGVTLDQLYEIITD